MVAGPAGSILTGETTLSPSFTANSAGTYTLRLTVSDGVLSTSDNVILSTTNRSPTANAGPDNTVSVGTPYILSGSATDPDNDLLTYAWSVVAGPAGSILTGETTLSPSFTANSAGTYTLRLTVSDGVLSSSDSVVLSTTNRAPTANAGADNTVTVGVAHVLSGTASDPDGDTLTYLWTVLSGPAGSTLTGATTLTPSFTANSAGTYTLQLTVSDGVLSASDNVILSTLDTWQWQLITLTNAPSWRYHHTAVWTGSEMIVWGGAGTGGVPFNTGGRYDPVTDSWQETTTTGAPDPRENHSAVWADNVMIVWGGADMRGGSYLNTGGRYDPAANSWLATSTTSAPTGRIGHGAVWTGAPLNRMIVWGGYYFVSTGGRYDPANDSWEPTSLTNAPNGRIVLSAVVWTGTEMIVWGGENGGISGGRYDPATDNWLSTSTINAPGSRAYHTAVWADNVMIVWGGRDGQDAGSPPLNTGGRYNPETDSWQATTTTGAPTARSVHTSVWTGAEMIVWGGLNSIGLDTGGRYDPATDAWLATSTVDVPAGRTEHTAVWTGTEMIIWGTIPSTGGRYGPPDTAAPAIASRNPGAGSSGISPATSVTVTFNERMDASTVTGTTFTLAAGGTPVAGSVTGSGIIYMFTPSAALVDSTTYTATITGGSSGVKDLAGNALAADNTWTFTTNRPPTANPGSPQTVNEGASVTLNGSASSDPDGTIASYLWEQTGGTSVTLTNATSAVASFTAPSVGPAGGTLSFRLTVTDSGGLTGSATTTVTVTNVNQAPTAAITGASGILLVDTAYTTLSGSTSSDPDGDPLTYAWTLTSRPSGSGTTLSGAGTVTPSFTPDLAGSYTVQLIVTDNNLAASSPVTATLATTNRAPTAAITGATGTLLVDTAYTALSGSTSSDPDGDALSYAWSFTSSPSGSGTTLSGAGTVTPSFTPDLAGSYTVQLIVTDNNSTASTPVTATLTTTNRVPTANAGADNTVTVGVAHVLSGTASDPDGDPLTYSWTVVAGPAGSTLAGETTLTPSFTANGAGTYTLQLTVSDEVLSASDNVVLSTTNRAPTVNAGADNTVAVGFSYTLSGTASDPDGDPIVYGASPLPSGAVFDNGTLTFNWTPGFAQSGSYTVTFTATDNGGLSTSEAVVITVTNTTTPTGLTERVSVS